MAHNHFLIVSMGSSGSRFLAQYLNRSQYLNVQHEGCPHRKPEAVEKANEWYSKRQAKAEQAGQAYGDVNGFMRYALPEYNFRVKALILRDWREILMSWASHWGKPHPVGSPAWVEQVQGEIARRKWLWHVEETVKVFDRYCHNVIPTIYFSKMTTDPKYLGNICFQFGAVDLRPAPEDLSRKVNEHNMGRVTEYEAIPAAIRGPFDRLTATFNEKYVLPYDDK